MKRKEKNGRKKKIGRNKERSFRDVGKGEGDSGREEEGEKRSIPDNM